MDGYSDRIALPYLSAGQAQKELSHNEALAILDVTALAAVEKITLGVPPASPTPGQCWIVASGPSGAWSGKAGLIAAWTGGGWRFIAPREGMRLWSIEDGCGVFRREGDWLREPARADGLHIDGQQVVGARAAAIASPSGGTMIGNEARATLSALLDMLRVHGLMA